MTVARKLDGLVIDHLLSAPVCTVEELRASLHKNGHRFTVQAIYYELRKLRERNVIMKAGSRFVLRLPWITDLQQRVNSALEKYREELESGTLIELFKNRSTIKVSSLYELHLNWNSVVSALLVRYPKDQYYEWAPYAWFALTPENYEEKILTRHSRLNIPFNTILGRRCFFNERYLKLRKGMIGISSFGNAPLRGLEKKYLSVHGDGIVTIALDKALSDKMHDLFSRIHRESDLKGAEVIELINKKGRISLKIELNPEKAESLRRCFIRSFSKVVRD